MAENDNEIDSLLLSLIEKEIPEGRAALADSHQNLFGLSEYCKVNYANSEHPTKHLEETKVYASQSLASVAYQIHSLAVNMLQMMDQQVIQLDKMASNANNIGLVVDIHKEKVARREIGVLTSSKNFSRSHKIVAPPQQEKPHKYKREEINFNALDHLGHGVKSERENAIPRRQSTSSSSGSLKGTSVSSIHSSSQGSIPSGLYQSVNTPPSVAKSVRPPVAPIAPFKSSQKSISSSHGQAPPPPSGPPQHIPKAPPAPTPPGSAMPPPPPIEIPTPDYNEQVNIPLPPPDFDEIYQIPPNNALAEDLPPPPPSNFYDQGDDILPPPPPMISSSGAAPTEKVVAIYDYMKLRDDELELFEGDVVLVLKKNDDGWYEGIKDGIQGLFPGNYVEPYV